MLDKFTIFSKGGIVLWSQSFATLQGDPVDELIQTVLLEERKGSDKSFVTGPYKVEWTFHNDLELVFVVVYQKILQLLYLEEMLELVKKKFCNLFGEAIKTKTLDLSKPLAFDKQFEKVQQLLEVKAAEAKQTKASQRRFEETKKGQEVKKQKKNDKKEKKENDEEKKEKQEAKAVDNSAFDSSGTPGDSNTATLDADAAMLAAREKMMKKMGTGPRGRAPGGPRKPGRLGGKPAPAPAPAAAPAPRKKAARKWDSDDEPERMDYSPKDAEKGGVPDQKDLYGDAKQAINPDDWNNFLKDKQPIVSDDEDEDEEEQQKPKSSGWSIGSIFAGLTNRVLKKEDLLPVLAKFRETLIAKNVASEIADDLCESVCTSLEGKTMSSFSRVRSTVKTTLESALTRILTPKTKVDLLQDIARIKKKENRPYTIVFVGVNGVGKSTNLAKVCAFLLQNNQKVMITACDTFRSGAVEQLRVHARNLDVPLFERGYEKDPAIVAMNGIYEGKQKNMDVVLIDTAGRMQDNKPLMQALAKLVYVNNPDLILFVGEALVGNEAVDQLRRFNLALEEHVPSGASKSRQIDGIILTKFDTIDDKVGAAISMVYTTGQPIVFVGTGQKYGDIKRMNIDTVIRALLG